MENYFVNSQLYLFKYCITIVLYTSLSFAQGRTIIWVSVESSNVHDIIFASVKAFIFNLKVSCQKGPPAMLTHGR